MTRNEIKRFRIFLSTYDNCRVGSARFYYHSYLSPKIKATRTDAPNKDRYGYTHNFDYVKKIEPVIVKQFKCELDFFLRNYINSINLWIFKPEQNHYYSNVRYF